MMMNQEKIFEDLVEKIKNKKVVLWIGSAFSTYAGYPTGGGLRDQIFDLLTQDEQIGHECDSLLTLTDYYEKIRGRPELISRLQGIFSDVPLESLEYHQKLSDLKRFDHIITTNYDRLFENTYGQDLIPIYKDTHIPNGCDPKKVKLYKIHGDILDGDSIIITSRDYRKFYSEKQNQLLWSFLKALTAQYSVLFIGYSISDENIQYMFEDIIEKVEKYNHNGLYLVSLGIKPYQIESFFTEYGLLYLEQDLFEFIEKLEHRLKNDILLDINNQIIPISDARESLIRDKGWEVSVTENHNGKNITIIPQDYIPVDFSLKKETPKNFIQRFQDFISGASFEPFTISNEELSYFNKFNIDGIFFFNLELEDGIKKEITAYPQALRGTAHIVSTTTGISLNNLSFEHFFSNNNFLLRIFNKSFEFSLYPDPNEINVNFHIEINHISDIIEGKTIYSLFKGWIEGDTLQVFTEHWNQALPIPSGSQIKNEPFYQHIILKNRIFSTFFKIQEITNKKIIIPDNITETDAETIGELISIIYEEPQINGGQITSTVTIVPGASISKKLAGFKLSGTKSQKFNIFGVNFCLAIEYMITGIDVELKNYDDIALGIIKGETDFEFIAESSKHGFRFMQKLSKDQSICKDEQKNQSK